MRAALDGLELIADTFLSVGTPVQVAAPELLRRGRAVRQAIHARVRDNLAARPARCGAATRRAICCRSKGGWSAVRAGAGDARPKRRSCSDLLTEAEQSWSIPATSSTSSTRRSSSSACSCRRTVFADAFERTLRFAVAA